MSQNQLIEKIVEYFDENIFQNHLIAALERQTKLSSYKINPIVVKYLSFMLEDDYTPTGVAKALYYPRVLGTSINTSFGQRIQNMFIDLEISDGSMISGMDIEFVDKIDGRKKWCQLKAGPNTINSGDVNPLIKEFNDTINLARTNKALIGISNNDFIVGVIYGGFEYLSSHYLRINETFPVYVGQEFWYRLTGFESFYDNLVKELHVLIDSIDAQGVLNEGVQKLSNEIEDSNLFHFSK